ncbi:GTP-binding protein [Metabacillus sp. HB246100]
MIKENQLIEKAFYKNYVQDQDGSPFHILGHLYFNEQNQDEDYDLSYIRFAQGELYYSSQDYETAIFKWENIDNELEAWAKMNIGDAYCKLQMLSAAEDMYTSITTDDETLKSEVALKLFTLYCDRQKIDNAYETIHTALLINPDYPNVTRKAREFYEEQQDHQNAVMLAVSECIRTSKEEWYMTLITYVKNRQTLNFSPEYFLPVLQAIYENNKRLFIQLLEAVWFSFKGQSAYLEWLKALNELIRTLTIEDEKEWDSIVSIYENTFMELTDGTYYLRELHHVIPEFISAWLTLSTSKNGLHPSATVLAWNEIFPGTVRQAITSKAESIIFETENDRNSLSDSLQLFHMIHKWANSHSLDLNQKTKWWAEEVMNRELWHHFLLLGQEGSGKTTFVQSLLGDKVYSGSTSSFVVLKDSDELRYEKMTEYTQQTFYSKNDLSRMLNEEPDALYQVFQPSIILHEQKCAIIDTPTIGSVSSIREDIFDTLLLVDGVFYLVDAMDPLTDQDYDLLHQIKSYAPNVKVNFILNKVDFVASDSDAEALKLEMKAKIASIYPHAEVLPYSSLHPFNQQFNQLSRFIDTNFPYDAKEKEERRTAKVLTLIRKMIADLLQKRVDMEKGYIHSIQWNEEILSRLTAFSHKVSDLQSERVESIAKAYRSLLSACRSELEETIPKLLKDSSEQLKEDSDFKTIHLTLNEYMNNKIKEYVEENVLPTIVNQLETWVSASHDELLQNQSFLIEMSDTFNDIYQEDKLSLTCQFAILDDWKRDIDRMTARIFYENENIMLKNKPTQMLLKGAGKLLGAFNQNNQVLYQQYKKYIENEPYAETTKAISDKLFMPFELFEKGLKKDIESFFTGPIREVKETIEEAEQNIEDGKEGLSNMKANPEVFYDPLKLFEVNLLQQEFMLQAHKDYTKTY